ncbi:MAG: nuclear transport factor 2 family protein [Nannocystaceae bacterium]|nr:nuclear transport factor 2 family protein [Nannocystaceae bacterium]
MASPSETVRRFYAAFGGGDTETMWAILAPDVRWTAAGACGVVPWAGAAHTREAAMVSIEAWRGAIEGLESQRELPLSDGECVVVRGQGRYRVRSTNRVVADRWVHMWQVRGGRIIAFDEYGDTAAAAAGFAGAR